MSNFIVHGGKKLKGSIEAGSGKNAPIALICASLLVKGRVILKDMSRAEEIERMLEIFESIGVKYNWVDEKTLSMDSSKSLRMNDINKKMCAQTRVVLLLLGALAAREKKYKLYKSGGCKLGNRTVRPHLFALERFGVKIESHARYYEITNKKLKSAEVIMYESGDTATENAIMAAVLAPGKTLIRYASANYMVQDLCHFLVTAGAKIVGIGTTTLTIVGVKKLHSVKNYFVAPDPVDAMAWLSLAITTRSNLTIKNCSLNFLDLELEHLKIMGQKIKIKNKRKSTNGHFPVADIQILPTNLKSLPDKLHGRPYPGLNIDNVPLFVPILTQASGTTLIHDWIYENRAVYYLELQKLGANVLLLDPHRALIKGPTKLLPNEVVCPPALRPGMAVLIAMLAAKGKSVLRNAYMIERGYERLIDRLQSVGADIERVD
jgi:UDP-N-acetylglucosamine 1-carboxyvinyltransferase